MTHSHCPGQFFLSILQFRQLEESCGENGWAEEQSILAQIII